jgi:hypothetical protein
MPLGSASLYQDSLVNKAIIKLNILYMSSRRSTVWSQRRRMCYVHGVWTMGK